MKPAQERNQECLPPKKRDIPVSSSSSGGGGAPGTSLGGGVGGGGCSGVDEVASTQSSGTSIDAQGGATSGEWLRAQTSLHYGMESSENIPAVPVDQYSMLYKVALPSGTYSSASLHPVLSHISPAYTVHSPLLQHPGIPYPPLGYAQIPHSSLQFVSPSYAAVPYAVPPGFVHGSIISPSGSISQPHTVSHLVPYSSVMQEGVVSPSSQAQVAAHTFTKVAASGGIPLMLTSEQAELSSRGLPVFYRSQGAIAGAEVLRDPHMAQQETQAKMNGGERDQGGMREVLPDSVFKARNSRLLQVAPSSVALEYSQDRSMKDRRVEERHSPGQRSTPDSDLEVQQAVGPLSTTVHAGSGGRKEVSFAPLNLSQGSQRAREAHGDTAAELSGRTAYAGHSISYSDPRFTALQQQTALPGHAVILANGQPVLIPMEYQPQPQQHHYACQANDVCSTIASAIPTFKPSDPPARVPSHFMKGAIIQLATGELKRVEDLQTQDFVRSAEVSGGLKIDSSMVVDIRASQQKPGLVALHFTVGEQQSKVTIDVPPEHPFFVFGQGWSSCTPERTAQLYGLACHHLQVGDVCVSITLQQQIQPQLPQKQPQQQPQQHHHPQLLVQQQQQQTLARTSKGSAGPGMGVMGAVQAGMGASQRRWSAPGLQRCVIKGNEGQHAQMATRPSFIPQEVKLSIEGRSNAGK
ncbi:unnamed protein product [Lota lota]